MISNQKIAEYNQILEGQSAEAVISFILQEFGDRIALSSSMGAEDQILTHMICQVNPKIKIFTLDTGRVFPETYSLIERTNDRYNIKIQVYFPDYKEVEQMVNKKGINLFYESIENRKLCCHIRKIEPLKRAFKDLDAWICGLRRDQSITRTSTKLVEWDENNELLKINPLVNWSHNEVWDYICTNHIPYNKLHDKGFASIGCQPCTRAIKDGEDIRSGRWWWENPEHKECGLHSNN